MPVVALPMLSLTDVSKVYPGGVRALDRLTMALPPGAFGLLGPNGAGKSTLMSLLATLQRPDSGTLNLNGVDIVRDGAQVRQQLGYMPQEFGFDPRLRVCEFMLLMASLKRVGRESAAQVEQRLTQVGLWSVQDRKIGTLSGGMKRRLGLAQALLGRPHLVLLDEPTAGLDPEQREHVLDVLADFSADAVLIISTHIADDIRRLCRRVGILVQGRLRFCGDVEDLLAPMRGNLWEAPLSAIEGDPEIVPLRTFLEGGDRRVRLIADAPPLAAFELAEPTLEDAYYRVLRRVPDDET